MSFLFAETVIHAFMNCFSLCALSFISLFFKSVNASFKSEVFILGFKYMRKERIMCQLIIFSLGQE